MGRLSSKVAIVTGAGQGCGLGVAQVFASEGASLVITGRVLDKLESVKPELEARGAKVVISAGDGAIRENARRAVRAAIDAFGRLDVLVNNAQATKAGVMVEDITDEDLDLTFGSGFRATLYHMQAAFPHLKERGGSIINFGSKMGIHAGPGAGSYASNKEAIRALSRVAAKEWGRYKIRVNVVNPASLSPGFKAYFKEHPEEEAVHLKDVALGYFGDPEKDVGQAVLLLALDESRYVTGQTINVDGGQVML
jgi:NAD(P)-dependent dehydrogenase (short-subunit alcohol dehydrogenase family)